MHISEIKHPKKKNMTTAVIDFPVYRCGMELFITNDIENVKHLGLDYTEDGGFNSADGMTCKEIDEMAMFYMILKPHADISTLVHECTHMINAIFCRIGYLPKPDNDEIQTHMIGELCRLVDDCLRRFKVNHKKFYNKCMEEREAYYDKNEKIFDNRNK